MKYKILYLFLIVLIACTGNDEETIPALTFEGSWKISEVNGNHESQNDWNGGILKIEQLDLDSGIYTYKNTPYDSIWPTHGKWVSIGNSQFIRDDSVYYNYSVRNNEMVLSAHLNNTFFDNCVYDGDTMCITLFGGSWVFYFDKIIE